MGFEARPMPSKAAHAAALGPNVLTSVENAKVDVIFLHGLTGHRERTWTAKIASSKGPPDG
ncbi:hypothetical protein J3E68DRAFT_428170 [Trichoderma sp. SZMC 28012]